MTDPTLDHEGEMRAYRAKREASLRAADGWLATTALSVLAEGKNLLPFGVVTVAGDSVHVTVHDGIEMRRNGEPVREGRLQPDQDDDVLFEGQVNHQLIRRGDALAIRTCDPESPLRREFPGAEWFPVNNGFRLRARAVPLEHPRTRELEYSVAATEPIVTEYVLVFEIGGVSYSLEPVVEPRRLLIQFRDLTNSELTSAVGRYLYAPLPHAGRTIVDFNQALTPGHVYNPNVISLVPPKRNTLYVRVEAGEKVPVGDSPRVLPKRARASG